MLTKIKFKLNIIFSEKIGNIQKKSEKFQIFREKMKNSEKNLKISDF